MAEKKPVKMSDADLKFFEDMLLEKRRELVTAQSDSEKANVFLDRSKPTFHWQPAKASTSFIWKKLLSASRMELLAFARFVDS